MKRVEFRGRRIAEQDLENSGYSPLKLQTSKEFYEVKSKFDAYLDPFTPLPFYKNCLILTRFKKLQILILACNIKTLTPTHFAKILCIYITWIE